MSDPSGLKQPAFPGERPTPFNGWAIAGLILGIIAVFATLIGFALVAVIGGFLAVILGLDGISKARKSGHGLGMAIAAICTGAVPLLILAYLLFRQ